MDKAKVAKLLKRKIYWERERDKIFYEILFYFLLLVGFNFKATNYSGIKQISKIGWSNSSGWEKFNCILDWILLVSLIIYTLLALYFFIRMQTIQRKLICINKKLLEALNDPNFE